MESTAKRDALIAACSLRLGKETSNMKLVLFLLFWVLMWICVSSVSAPALAGGYIQSSTPTKAQVEAADKAAINARIEADEKTIAAKNASAYKLYTNWTWANKPWTGDDDAFAAARAKIDIEFKVVADPGTAAEAYKNAAVDNSHNALEQFRWAYACYCAEHSKNAHAQQSIDTGQPLVALASATQPHCYNYERLILLFMSPWPQEYGLAQRLLKRDPNDIPIKYHYAEILALSLGDANKAKALKIAHDMVDSKQDVPECYFLLGYVYDTTATKDNQVDHYPKAIAAFDRYIALAGSNASGRTVALQAEGYMKRKLQQGQ
jgi:hypothetical protein